MTIAQAFNIAFDSWKETQEKEKEDIVTIFKNCKIKEQTKSDENDSDETTQSANGYYTNKDCDEPYIVEQNFLIDLSSPGDSLDDKTSSASLVNIETNKTEDMDEKFSM